MLNFALLSRWQNWLTVWLMFAIAMVGLHSFAHLFDNPQVKD